MRIAVIGAGAMGSIFAARFAQGGHEVTLVDVAAPLVEHINAEGVTIVRDDEETVTELPATVGPSGDRRGRPRCLLRQVLPHRVGRRDSAAAGWLRHDRRLAPERLGQRRRASPMSSILTSWSLASPITAAQCWASVESPIPGSGRQPSGRSSTNPATAPSDSPKRYATVASRLRVARPVRPEIWKKLILNAASLPDAALTGMTAGALTAYPDTHELITEIARRRSRSPNALGYEIDGSAHTDYIHGLAARAGASKASMLQDFEGRPQDRDRRDQRRGGEGCRRTGCRCSAEPCPHAAGPRLGVQSGSAMTTRLTYLGAAGYEIDRPTHRILIDPFLTDNPLAPCGPTISRRPDVILVSHAAIDHFGDTPSIAKRTAPGDLRHGCSSASDRRGLSPDQVTLTTWGIVVEVAGLRIRPVECHHWSLATLVRRPAGRRAIRSRSSSRPSQESASTTTATPASSTCD